MAVGAGRRRPSPTGISRFLPPAGTVNDLKSASFALLVTALAGCSSLLPQSKETSGPAGGGWQSYQDAERTFAGIVPGTTTDKDLAALKLDPRSNANVAELPRYEL